MSNKSAALAILAAVAMLAVAGCGSSSSSADRPKQELFARQAETVCVTANQEARGIRAPRSIDAAFAKTVVTLRNRVVRGLKEVDVPDDRSAEYDRFVELLELQTALYRRLVRATLARQGETVRRLATINQAYTNEETALGRSLGISVCAG